MFSPALKTARQVASIMSTAEAKLAGVAGRRALIEGIRTLRAIAAR